MTIAEKVEQKSQIVSSLTNDNLKTWPEKMYFQGTTDEYDLPHFIEVDMDNLSFCTEQIFNNDVEYVRADLAEAEKNELKETIDGLHDLCMRHIIETDRLRAIKT